MKNKSAIVTGASKGIGRAVATHLADKGYHLLLIARSKDLLEELQDEINKTRRDIYVSTVAADVFCGDIIKREIDNFYEKTQSMDLLINNAGYVKRGTSDLDGNELSRMLDSNVIGAVNLIRSVVPIMKIKNSGYIINMCSRNAKLPRSFLGGYAASKAALLAFSESLYKEMKDTNIKVTALCPGFVDTEMTSDITEGRDRFISPSDICIAIDFLMSLSSSVALKELSFESVVQIGGFC